MPGSELQIRPAGADDLPAVRDLLVETWHDTYDRLLGPAKVSEITGTWHAVEALRAQLSLPDASFLVAEENGAVVGHILADAQRPPSLVISRLYVRPSAQGRGIGKRLMAEAAARRPRSREFLLDVQAGNPGAIRFYRREGFEPVGRHMEAGIEHIRMRRILPGASEGA